MSLLFNMLSRLVIAFLPRSKHLLASWLQSPSTAIFGAQENKYVTVFIVSLYICHEVMGPNTIIYVFWMLSFKPSFSLSCFTFIKRLFSSSLFFCYKCLGLSLCVFSRVWLLATLGLYPTRLLWPWNFPGKNTGVGCHFFLQGKSFWPGNQTQVSCISCIGRWIFYHWATFDLKI